MVSGISGQNKLPITIDLKKLAASIEVRGGNRRLASALRTAWRTQSCLADLRQAESACEALDRLPPVTDQKLQWQLQTGLLATAVILYARATHTGGSAKERGAVTLDPGKLTEEQKADHLTLVRLRNGALGHVETSARIAGDLWHRDLLFAKDTGTDGWQIASASLSIGFHAETADMLKRQIPIATDLLAIKSRQRLDDAVELLRQAQLSESAMMRYAVDPIAWFGSVEAALVALAGDRGDESSAWLPLR